MVVNRVIFTILGYDLLQIYLLCQTRKELNKKTLPRIRQQLLPSNSHVIVYFQNCYALFRPLQIVELVAILCDEERNKIAQKCRRLRLELKRVIINPRPP